VDIGSPAFKGSSAYSSGRFTITAAGSDIWGTTDQFHFVYQPISGDADVSLRVESISNVNRWSKAGVMIRESLNPHAAHATMFLSAGNGYAFQRRPQADGISENTSGGSGTAPGWIRLKRNGSLFTAYKSSDGRTWTVVGSDTIQMASAAYVGIAVTSHNASAATVVTASSLSIKGGDSTDDPPSVRLTSPSAGAIFRAPATVTLTASATDPEGRLAKVEFYVGSTRLGTDTSAPYTFTWSASTVGTFALTAVAYDAAGNRATSPSVNVAVQSGTSSEPPPTDPPPITAAPRYVVFQASPDHAALVVSYRLDVFSATANPSTARPLATVSLGKPTPDAVGDIKSDLSTFFGRLTAGEYQATVTAVGSQDSSVSTAIKFLR
jgi:hypothetical protein